MHTFRQLDRFLAIWNDGLSNPDKVPLTRADLDKLWAYARSIAEGPDVCYEREMLKIEKKERD